MSETTLGALVAVGKGADVLPRTLVMKLYWTPGSLADSMRQELAA